MRAPFAVFPVLWSTGFDAPVATVQGSGAAKAAVLIPVFAAFYLLPVLLAWLRQSPRKWKITIIGLCLGWTGIGWVAAMLMNFAYAAPPDGTADHPHLPSA